MLPQKHPGAGTALAHQQPKERTQAATQARAAQGGVTHWQFVILTSTLCTPGLLWLLGLLLKQPVSSPLFPTFLPFLRNAAVVVAAHLASRRQTQGWRICRACSPATPPPLRRPARAAAAAPTGRLHLQRVACSEWVGIKTSKEGRAQGSTACLQRVAQQPLHPFCVVLREQRCGVASAHPQRPHAGCACSG